MKKIFKIELERAFMNKKFLIVLLLETALIVYDFVSYGVRVHNEIIPFYLKYAYTGKIEVIPGALSTWIGLRYGQSRTILYSVLPLLGAFIYGSSLYGDEKVHYVYQVITRTRRSNYYAVKLIVLFLSGGVCAVFPFALSLLLNAMLLPFEAVVPCLRLFMSEGYLLSGLFYAHPVIYIFIYMAYVFAGFGLLNCICYIASYVFSNGYVVMAAPFCVYFCSLVIGNIMESTCIPWDYLRMNDILKAEIPQILFQAVILLLVLAGTFYGRSRKKADIL